MSSVPGDSPFADRLIVVLGTIRSGTTWLAQLLLAHPDLVGGEAESTIFTALLPLWQNGRRGDGEGAGAYLSPDQLAGLMRTFCDRMFAEGRHRFGSSATWFVQKSPDDLDAIPLLAELYPDAWCINIVRDGRDVVRSILESPFGTDDAAAAARYWARAADDVERQKWRLARFREVRYEALVADPLGQVSGLFEWMGLSVDEAVRRELEVRADKEVSRYNSSEPVGPGKWTKLPPTQLEQVVATAGELLAYYGYLGGPPSDPHYGGPMTDIPPDDDALEQRQEVGPVEEDDTPSGDPEVPEADALEQAQVVPLDDDEMRG